MFPFTLVLPGYVQKPQPSISPQPSPSCTPETSEEQPLDTFFTIPEGMPFEGAYK
jgi:hypothetical protein